MSDDLLTRTTEIVTAYFANGGAANMSPGDVPDFIAKVHRSLSETISFEDRLDKAAARLGEPQFHSVKSVGLTSQSDMDDGPTAGEPIEQRIRHKIESVYEKPIRAPEFQRPADSPAVPIDESVTHDFIICLEDGHKTKLLKRYIRTKFDMTPEEYKTKWKLPADYPFTAPEYSERRAQIASTTGLGKND